MRALWIFPIVFMAAAVVLADKKSEFSVGLASSYPARQTNDKVTVAVMAYDTEELAHTAFGKLNPNQYGILPVLVIIQNDTDQALKLENLHVEYTGFDNRGVEATPAQDVQTLNGPVKTPSIDRPSPIPHWGKKKNPLNTWEIEGRAFAAKMLPPHEPANGFFYFQTEHRPGSKLYLTGIKVAATGKDVFFFDIPFDK
jgi:hypothetical protein